MSKTVIYSINKCRRCWVEIRKWISLCYDCEDIKKSCYAKFSTNKKRLNNLLAKRDLNKERFDKFNVYVKNILDSIKDIFTFKELTNNYQTIY